MREKAISHSFALQPSLLKWIRQEAHKRNISMSKFVLQAILHYKETVNKPKRC